MTARDAQTWGATASARQAEAAVRAVNPTYPKCERCVPTHDFHGLKCRFCDCLTSWTDEGDVA